MPILVLLCNRVAAILGESMNREMRSAWMRPRHSYLPSE